MKSGDDRMLVNIVSIFLLSKTPCLKNQAYAENTKYEKEEKRKGKKEK